MSELFGRIGMPDSLLFNSSLLKGNKMPKLKTKRAAAKRFGVTGTGKLKRNHSFKRHLLFNKPKKMKRQARGSVIIAAANKFVKKFLPFI